MRRDLELRGLYAITDQQLGGGRQLLDKVEAAILGGARLIQYRDKSDDRQRRKSETEALKRLCIRHGVKLIVNDDLSLARSCKADGVHLGKDDADIKTARSMLGSRAIIGVSCYNRLELAIEAKRSGADYIAFGRFFPSSSKPDAVQADTSLLIQARRLGLPMVAIGGITSENGGPLIEAGAHMLAVIQGVFGQDDIRSACEQFNRLFCT